MAQILLEGRFLGLGHGPSKAWKAQKGSLLNGLVPLLSLNLKVLEFDESPEA